MCAMSFYFARIRDNCGTVVALVGVRVHHGMIDVVQFYGEHEADAVRILSTAENFVLPFDVLWSTSGRPPR
jgi:hypothetical protein